MVSEELLHENAKNQIRAGSIALASSARTTWGQRDRKTCGHIVVPRNQIIGGKPGFFAARRSDPRDGL